jgi:hypothetical protein
MARKIEHLAEEAFGGLRIPICAELKWRSCLVSIWCLFYSVPERIVGDGEKL